MLTNEWNNLEEQFHLSVGISSGDGGGITVYIYYIIYKCGNFVTRQKLGREMETIIC